MTAAAFAWAVALTRATVSRWSCKAVATPRSASSVRTSSSYTASPTCARASMLSFPSSASVMLLRVHVGVRAELHLCLEALSRRGAVHELHLLPLLLSYEHLPRLGALKGPDDAELLHLVHQPRRARIAQLQPALEHGDARLLGLEDDVHRLGQQLVELRLRLRLLGLTALGRAVCGLVLRGLFDLLEDVLGVLGRGAALDEVDDVLALLVGDVGALHAHGLAAAKRRIQHVAHAY